MEKKETSNEAGKLELLASQNFELDEPYYKIIDFLNRSLKDKKLMFGLKQQHEKYTITIYEVE